MTDIKILSSSDYFFYYDKFAVNEMNEHDMSEMLSQPKRSLFYARQTGVGIHDSENYPNSLPLLIGLRYDIVNSTSIRNTQVVDGSEGYNDRRIALGQETIKVEQESSGEVDLTVWYVSLYNYEQVNNVTLPMSTSS